MPGYMLDSNVFDKLAEEDSAFLRELGAAGNRGLRLFITRIQEHELNEISNEERRDLLSSVVTTVSPEVAVSPAVYGVSTYGDVLSVYASAEQEFMQEAWTKGNFEAHGKDAVIAGTASSLGLILVTEDRRMAKRARELGLQALTYNDFRASLSTPGR